MRAVEIDLFPNQNATEDHDQFYEHLENFLRALRGDGNLCADWIVLQLEGKVQVRCMAPASDALDVANWNIYAQQSYEKIVSLSQSLPELKVIPEVTPDDMCCECTNPPGFVLYLAYALYPIPVDCLDCGRTVPLYRLPHLDGHEEHWTLRQWNKNGETLDQLFMNSWWGERMAYHQLSNPRSGFMNYSRNVASELEKLTGKPAYVFLLNLYEPRGDACLRCGRPWLWPNSPTKSYAFKCDHCRLISQQPTGDPDSNPLPKLHP